VTCELRRVPELLPPASSPMLQAPLSLQSPTLQHFRGYQRRSLWQKLLRPLNLACAVAAGTAAFSSRAGAYLQGHTKVHRSSAFSFWRGSNSGTHASRLRAVGTAVSSATGVQEDYAKLASKLKEISALGGISGLLGWDEMTFMPQGAAGSRASQKQALAGILHAKQTDAHIVELLSRLQQSDVSSLDPYQRATIREASREFGKASSVTDDLVRKEAELESRGYHNWVEARQAKDWNKFAPVLKEWIQVRRERASMIDPSKEPYDVLVDDYSAGLTAARIDEIFGEVKDGLVPLLADLRTKGTAPDSSWLNGKFDTDKQASLCRDIALALGFDLNKGRLDVSVHPFTGGAHPTDVRMTTRFKEEDVLEGLTGAIHETGHALYEQGRNLDHDGLPVSAAAGMAVHESQSLLWERMVGLSEPFAEYLFPKLRATFPDAFPSDKNSADLYAAMNVIKSPSLIRVEADEVTYPLHIILRFEIEKGLIDGTIQVDDVPKIWNSKMKEFLGVDVESDDQGCLQDVHWSAGLAGYFPTYSLGAMAAVQIFQAAHAEIPDLDKSISEGKFQELRDWLRNKIHQVGSLHPTADDLLVAVTGKPLDPQTFLQYLHKKYSKLYQLPVTS